MRFPTKKKNKYGNTPVKNLCFYGYTHRSLLERAVCDIIAWEEKAGKIIHEAHEDSVILGPTRYRCVPDFRIRVVETGEIRWREAKGDHKASRFPMTKKQWKVYGPGPLEIWMGNHRRPVLTKTIIPDTSEFCIECGAPKKGNQS